MIRKTMIRKTTLLYYDYGKTIQYYVYVSQCDYP